MAEKAKTSTLRLLVALALVLLLVYCVSLSAFVVYLMRDYNELRYHIQDLRDRVILLEDGTVNAVETTVSPSSTQDKRDNKDSRPQAGESIHLVGTGRTIKASNHLITRWKLSHRFGSIDYHEQGGTVEIKKEGFYFIYSQMFYYDGSTIQMAHLTYINHKKVLESMASVINKTKKFNTKFHGGVFLLRVNDTISVRVPYTKYYHMEATGSFFGAFMLHHAHN